MKVAHRKDSVAFSLSLQLDDVTLQPVITKSQELWE